MKIPPTIPAPLPTDHRLLRLAGLLQVGRRDAMAATIEVWAWIAAQATDGIVPQPVALLDGVAEIPGFGDAAVAVGLVGTADGHIVAPAELRQAAPVGGSVATASDDVTERKRQQARARQRRRRSGSRLTGKLKTPTPTDADAATSTTPSRRSRRLGSVAPGQDVMLLWSKRNGEFFYKCTGATPDLTGTVTDQDNPTLADALKALLDARQTQAKRDEGKLGETVFSPSMEQLVAAARRERDEREAAAAAAARLDEGNVALSRAADDDADQGDHEPEPPAAEPVTPTADAPSEGIAERDCHAPVTHVTRDSVTCHAPVTRDTDAKALPSNGLDAVFCHAPVTLAAASSSSSLYSENERKENTTTTSGLADHERDIEPTTGDEFSRYLKATGCRPTLKPEQAALVERLADALGTTPDAIREQGRYQPDILLARCHAARIDPRTGLPLADEGDGHGAADAAAATRHAPTSPHDAPGAPIASRTGVHAPTGVQAAGGIVAAPVATPPPPRQRSGLQAAGDIVTPPDDAADHERDRATAQASRSPRTKQDAGDDTAVLKAQALRAIAAAG